MNYKIKKIVFVSLILFLYQFIGAYLYAQDIEHRLKDVKTAENSNLKSEKAKKHKISIPPVLVDDFNKGSTEGLFSERLTSIGAFQGTWAKRPSWSIITKTSEIKRGKRGKALKMEWENLGGWCGWYTLLDGLDASNYNALTFWVKGAKGGERFDVGLADSLMQELEIDAKYVGAVTFFLKKGITTQWQKVKIPLSRVGADINISSLGSLVFWFRYENPEGSSVIYIDDIMLENDPEVEKMQEYNAPRAELNPRHPRTMWVWKIDPVVNLRARNDLFELCLRTAIRTCYVYFGDFNQDDDPQYTKQLEEFLKAAHKLGIKIEILTGNPTWALKENHHFAYNWLKAFLDYNKKRPPELRVDGCSFDVEPYLTGEWETRKDEVKVEYIDLLKSLRELIDSYGDMDFEIGGAIPIFYSQEGDFEEQLLTYLDYSALMAYHDSPRKVIDCSRDHIALAGRIGKKIYLGAETQDLVSMKQGRRSLTFYEEGWEEMEQVLTTVETEFDNDPGYGGLAIHCYYSYALLQRGRNTPSKIRQKPDELYHFISNYQGGAVEIDGNLDDWILDDPTILDHKMQVVYGRGAWGGKEDYSVNAYSMWDIYNIYFAFKIIDNKLVQNKTKTDMWEGDHVEFWLDVDLLGDYNEAMNSKDDFQFGFSPGNFNNVEPEVYMFVPEYDPDEYLDKVEIAALKTKNGYIIEVRIDAGLFNNINIKSPATSPEKQSLVCSRDMLADGIDVYNETHGRFLFSEGMMLGFSIDGSDCDDPNAPQKLLMSSSSERIWGDPTTFNIIKLIKKK
ncbi:hypothetical protein J7L67_06600 [bacterium]|nr:hypothetical protein [bacterium]